MNDVACLPWYSQLSLKPIFVITKCYRNGGLILKIWAPFLQSFVALPLCTWRRGNTSKGLQKQRSDPKYLSSISAALWRSYPPGIKRRGTPPKDYRNGGQILKIRDKHLWLTVKIKFGSLISKVLSVACHRVSLPHTEGRRTPAVGCINETQFFGIQILFLHSVTRVSFHAQRRAACPSSASSSFSPSINDLHNHLTTATGRTGTVVIEWSCHMATLSMTTFLNNQDYSPNCGNKLRIICMATTRSDWFFSYSLFFSPMHWLVPLWTVLSVPTFSF